MIITNPNSITRISFPTNEIHNYRRRLTAGKMIYTTRVAQEVGRYQLGQVYHSRLDLLRVGSLQHCDKLADHPFYLDMLPWQQQQIEKYLDERGLDVIGLALVDKS